MDEKPAAHGSLQIKILAKAAIQRCDSRDDLGIGDIRNFRILPGGVESDFFAGLRRCGAAALEGVTARSLCKLMIDVKQQVAYMVNCYQELPKQGPCRTLGEGTHRKD